MGCASSRNSNREFEFLVLGLENAGKSRFINSINDNSAQDFYPLVAVNVQKIHYQNNKIRLWEVRGTPEGKSLWSDYYANKHGVIYVLDGSDTGKYLENEQNLRKIIENEALKGVPLVVLVNKRDKGVEIRVNHLKEMLKSMMEKNPRFYAVHEISAETKERVLAGIHDLLAFHQPSCVLVDKRKKYGYVEPESREKEETDTSKEAAAAADKNDKDAKSAKMNDRASKTANRV